MYKAITSFWSKSLPSNKIQSSSEINFDEESWIFISNSESSPMTNSWIASPPLIKTDDSSENVHHFNPIENLLIEHASMSVYEQIASKTRNRRQRKPLNDNKLDEQSEEEEEEEVEEEEGTVNHSYPNVTSIHHQNLTTNLDSSTSSLVAHYRHLHRLHQRRKRPKIILEQPKQVLNKNLERTRLRSSKIPLQQSVRSNPS